MPSGFALSVLNCTLLFTGETITLPANIPHAVKAATRFKMLLTMIRA
jgi:quercetin dioxygenase-like cupin family protein